MKFKPTQGAGSKSSDERDASDHQKGSNDPPKVYRLHRHVKEAVMIDDEGCDQCGCDRKPDK
jgi:hypothetical protein